MSLSELQAFFFVYSLYSLNRLNKDRKKDEPKGSFFLSILRAKREVYGGSLLRLQTYNP